VRLHATRGASPGSAGVSPALPAGRGLAYALLGFAMAAWGGSFVAARMLLAPADARDVALAPIPLAALRFTIAAILFVPPIAVRRWRGRPSAAVPPRPLDRGDLLRLAALGQLGITLYFWLQYTGVRLTNAGVASILVVGLIPIATGLAARARLGEALGRAQIPALAFGLAGVAAQRGSGLALGFSPGFAAGAVCLVVDAACFAVYSTLIRDLRARYDALTLTAGVTATGAAGLLVLTTLTGGWREVARLSGTQWLAVAYLALVCSVLAYLSYNRALATLEAGRAAAWVYLEPPIALLLGAWLLGERVSPASLLGGALIAAAVALASRRR